MIFFYFPFFHTNHFINRPGNFYRPQLCDLNIMIIATRNIYNNHTNSDKNTP